MTTSAVIPGFVPEDAIDQGESTNTSSDVQWSLWAILGISTSAIFSIILISTIKHESCNGLLLHIHVKGRDLGRHSISDCYVFKIASLTHITNSNSIIIINVFTAVFILRSSIMTYCLASLTHSLAQSLSERDSPLSKKIISPTYLHYVSGPISPLRRDSGKFQEGDHYWLLHNFVNLLNYYRIS